MKEPDVHQFPPISVFISITRTGAGIPGSQWVSFSACSRLPSGVQGWGRGSSIFPAPSLAALSFLPPEPLGPRLGRWFQTAPIVSGNGKEGRAASAGGRECAYVMCQRLSHCVFCLCLCVCVETPPSVCKIWTVVIDEFVMT